MDPVVAVVGLAGQGAAVVAAVLADRADPVVLAADLAVPVAAVGPVVVQAAEVRVAAGLDLVVRVDPVVAVVGLAGQGAAVVAGVAEEAVRTALAETAETTVEPLWTSA